RPPFTAATVLETLEQVRSAEPVPPGRLNPQLPRDLETVCLKCLQKDPRRRYDSALALAEDLERWLRHETIRAQPVSRVERLRKWVSRQPALAALCALTLLVLLASAVAVAVFTMHLAEERNQARDREQRVRGALGREAEQGYFTAIAMAQRELARGEPSRAQDLVGACR